MPDITFLMGQDPAGASNQFYSLAKQYFTAAGGTVVDAPSAKGQTLEGVFAKLTSLGTAQTTINIVCHATGYASMEFGLTSASTDAWVDADDLQNALNAKVPAAPGSAIISSKTRVVIYGCDVGRSSRFLTMLSGLFGDPGEILAPKRIAVFMLSGDPAKPVKYRLAQTWSVAQKSPLVVAGTAAPAGGWDAFRKTFVTNASFKFGRAVAGTGDPLGDSVLTSMLTDAAKTATTATAATFFLQEEIDIFADKGQTAAQAAATISPISNGDPITSFAPTVGAIDDTTVLTTVTSADTYPTTPAKTAFTITVAILAQIMDHEPLIAQGPDYASYTSGKARAPSPGPKAASAGDGGDGGGAVADGGDPMQAATQALLDGGASQADIDALDADAPTGDGTADIDTDAPQVALDDGDTGSGSPETLESA
ncbi:MAG TPA: hypothetical protein VGM94_02950 [Galbitalea sp.]